mgnify:CR=1 FL=1
MGEEIEGSDGPHPSGAIERVGVDLTIRDVQSAQWDALGEHVAVRCVSVSPSGRTQDRLVALEGHAAAGLLLLLARVLGGTDTTAGPEP